MLFTEPKLVRTLFKASNIEPPGEKSPRNGNSRNYPINIAQPRAFEN